MVAIDLNIIVFVVLLAFFFVFLLKKISFKIIMIIGMIFLGIAAGFFLSGLIDQANTIATFAFGVFIVAAILATIEYLRDLRWEDLIFTCPSCGTQVQSGFKFCPECGKPVSPPQHIIDRKKGKEAIRNDSGIKLSRMKLTKKISRKMMMSIVAIICIAVIVVAAAFYIIHQGGQNTNINAGSGRTLTITVNNNFTSNASCYLIIDGLRQGAYGNPEFIMNASDTTVITIDEDNLSSRNTAHSIELVVTIGDVTESDVAATVTKSASFLINNVEGQFDTFYVQCTAYF